jgi:hypothetical protein
VGADCFNCLNQHHVTIINQNLIRTGSINPATCGTAGTSCTATEADQAGFDYGVLMSKGFDYTALANSQKSTLSTLYGQPQAWQTKRSLRFQVRITF